MATSKRRLLVSNSTRSMNTPQRRTMSTTPLRWKRFILFVSFLFLIAHVDSEDISELRNTISMEDVDRAAAESASTSVNDRMSIVNMTCKVFEQPLNHFVPRGRSPAYKERYCTYDGFVTAHKGGSDDGNDRSPIFFYTGNESPLEQYINQVCCPDCSIYYATNIFVLSFSMLIQFFSTVTFNFQKWAWISVHCQNAHSTHASTIIDWFDVGTGTKVWSKNRFCRASLRG